MYFTRILVRKGDPTQLAIRSVISPNPLIYSETRSQMEKVIDQWESGLSIGVSMLMIKPKEEEKQETKEFVTTEGTLNLLRVTF